MRWAVKSTKTGCLIAAAQPAYHCHTLAGRHSGSAAPICTPSRRAWPPGRCACRREAGWRVGLVWKRNRNLETTPSARLPSLAALAPLAALPGVQWISLQRRRPSRGARAPMPPCRPLGEDFADLADTAAVLRQLDLVISVDTAAPPGRRAGRAVLGAAARLPNRLALAGRARRQPWYPGCLRLFRQPTRGDWATPIQRVAQTLQRPGAMAARQA